MTAQNTQRFSNGEVPRRVSVALTLSAREYEGLTAVSLNIFDNRNEQAPELERVRASSN